MWWHTFHQICAPETDASLPFPKNFEMGLNLYWEWGDCFPEKLLCWWLQPISYFSKSTKYPIVEHGMYPIKEGGKFLFNMAFFLRNTWGSILKCDTCLFPVSKSIQNPHFLWHTTLCLAYLNTKLNFKFLSWYWRTAPLPKFWSA